MLPLLLAPTTWDIPSIHSVVDHAGANCTVRLIRRTSRSKGCVSDVDPRATDSSQRAFGIFGCEDNATIYTARGCAGVFMCANGHSVKCGGGDRSMSMTCTCSGPVSKAMPSLPPLPPTPPLSPISAPPPPSSLHVCSTWEVAYAAQWCRSRLDVLTLGAVVARGLESATACAAAIAADPRCQPDLMQLDRTRKRLLDDQSYFCRCVPRGSMCNPKPGASDVLKLRYVACANASSLALAPPPHASPPLGPSQPLGRWQGFLG